MQVTLDIPDPLAKKFFSTTPARQRSSTVARLLRAELRRKELTAACLAANQDAQLKPGWFSEQFKDFIGCVKNGPTDLAENHDHYAHGAPKRSKP